MSNLELAKLSRAELVWYAVRIAAAFSASITVHYIGFFSALGSDYYLLMSSTLIRRVGWELISTVAHASLILAVGLFVMGLFKGSVLGAAGVLEVLPEDMPMPNGRSDGGFIITCVAAVLAVHYFPLEGSVGLRSLYAFSTIGALGVLAYVFFADVKANTKWSLFVSPFRQASLIAKGLIAFILLICYLAGAGLANQLLSVDPMQITTTTGELNVVIIDANDVSLLVLDGDRLLILPMHQVLEVVVSTE